MRMKPLCISRFCFKTGMKMRSRFRPHMSPLFAMFFCPPGHIKRHENHRNSHGFMPFDLSVRISDEMSFVAVWGRRSPGVSISRIFTREGAAVPGGRACRDQTPAPGGGSGQSVGPTFSSVSVQKQMLGVSPKTSFAIVSYSVVMLPFTSCRLSAKN